MIRMNEPADCGRGGQASAKNNNQQLFVRFVFSLLLVPPRQAVATREAHGGKHDEQEREDEAADHQAHLHVL